MSKSGLMAADTFEAALARSPRLSAVYALAARRVLVDGMGLTAAARAAGVPYRQSVYRAVNCIRRAAIIDDRCSVCGHAVVSKIVERDRNKEGAAALSD